MPYKRKLIFTAKIGTLSLLKLGRGEPHHKGQLLTAGRAVFHERAGSQPGHDIHTPGRDVVKLHSDLPGPISNLSGR
jgi:hypothetical protein